MKDDKIQNILLIYHFNIRTLSNLSKRNE